MVVTDFELTQESFDEWTIYLMQWIQERKSSIHLCCRKLNSCASPVSNVIEIFKLVDLNCILELQLSQWWPEVLEELDPYLEGMNNLHTLMLEGLKPFRFTACEEDQEDEWQSTLPSLLSNFGSLQNLYLNDIYLLEDSLDKWLNCLTTPSETLSITDCPRLLQSDFKRLPPCLNICKHKHRNLNALFLSDVSHELPGLIPGKVSSTLQTLELEPCRMRAAHFSFQSPLDCPEPMLPAPQSQLLS